MRIFELVRNPARSVGKFDLEDFVEQDRRPSMTFTHAPLTLRLLSVSD
jgi:hypothetical protein